MANETSEEAVPKFLHALMWACIFGAVDAVIANKPWPVWGGALSLSVISLIGEKYWQQIKPTLRPNIASTVERIANNRMYRRVIYSAIAVVLIVSAGVRTYHYVIPLYRARVLIADTQLAAGQTDPEITYINFLFWNDGKMKATQVTYLFKSIFPTFKTKEDAARSGAYPMPEKLLENERANLLHDPRWPDAMKDSHIELSPNRDDGRYVSMWVPSSEFQQAVNGQAYLYFLVDFKYKDWSMADDTVGVTETCSYLFGNAAVHDCGTRTFPERANQ